MNNELRQRASESADRMARAGMTLSAGVMAELIADVERLAKENAAAADYIHCLELELTQSSRGAALEAVLDAAQELGEANPQLRELRLNYMVLAGEMNN
jgi:hypothetical protein